jgi:ABC-type multidrug transport system fused ATPase/permease subunit
MRASTAGAGSKGAASNVPAPERKSDLWPVLGRIMTYMAGEESRSRFIVAVILRSVGLIGLILMPWLTGQAINVATAGGPSGSLAMWCLAAIFAGLFYLVLSYVAERQFADLATHGLEKLQTHLFNHMQTLSLSFFDRQPIGELLSRVTNDSEAVARFYESAASQIIRAIIQIALVFVIMLVISVPLTIASMVVVPFMLLLTFTVERISSPAFAKMQEEMGKISGFQEESISGHKVVMSNRRQEWAGDANDELAGDVFDVGSKAFFTSLLQFPLTTALIMVMTVIVLFVGAFMVLDGQMTLGVVIAFSGYAALLGGPLSDIANLSSTALNAVAGGRRVFSILDEQPTIVDAPDAKPYEFKGGEVVFDDVDFSYVPGRKILRHNTFEARPGMKIGLVGPTGAGKSTIINILTRYYETDSGRILIDGQDLRTLTQESLRQQVGVVPQEAFLFTDTVMNNLLYAREGATEAECIEAAQRANAHDFIVNLPQGYDTMMTERGANLSQGQRQMITIARAMVANPKLLVLDEATSNVDTRTEKLIQEGIMALSAGKTSFVIAHRLSTVRDSAKVLVINAGEIVESGAHDELMAAKGFYYTLFMSQFKGKAPGGAEAGTADFSST